MKKTLIAGLATVIIAGTALVGTGMYAAVTTSTDTNTVSQDTHGPRMNRGNPEDLIATLSGKVSIEALTAFETLMAKHKAEMDAVLTNTGTTIDKTAMDTQRDVFKTEMDALLAKYPELKAAMPTMPQGGKMGRGNGEIETIMATLPSTVQTEIKTIRESYQVKQEALRTEEKTKIDTILASYPEIKAKLDAAETSRPQKEGRGHHGMDENQDNSTTTTNTSK